MGNSISHLNSTENSKGQKIPKNWKKTCAKDAKWCQEFIVQVLVDRKAKKLMRGIKQKKLTRKERKKVKRDCGILAKYNKQLDLNYCSKGAGGQLVNRYIKDAEKNRDDSRKGGKMTKKAKNRRSGLATDETTSGGDLWVIALLVFTIALAAVAVYFTFKKKDSTGEGKEGGDGAGDGAGDKSKKSTRTSAKGSPKTSGAIRPKVGKSMADKSGKHNKVWASSKGDKSKASKKSKKLKSIKSKKSGKIVASKQG